MTVALSDRLLRRLTANDRSRAINLTCAIIDDRSVCSGSLLAELLKSQRSGSTQAA